LKHRAVAAVGHLTTSGEWTTTPVVVGFTMLEASCGRGRRPLRWAGYDATMAAQRGGARDETLVTVGRHPLVGELRKSLRGPCRVVGSARVIVAVSGGADSLALMLAMAAIAQRSRRSGGVVPIVVHVDHRLRPESGADARFVVRQARRVNLPVEVVAVDVDAHRRRGGGNIEATARSLRYAALATAAARHDCKVVMTAHHAEDQLETMLMNLCRGCGATALAGMPRRRPLDESEPNGPVLVRPLLGISREACRDLCRTARRRWRHDPTNDDARRTRARLRSEVLPVLDSIWPDAARRAARTADLLREILSESLDAPPRLRESV